MLLSDRESCPCQHICTRFHHPQQIQMAQINRKLYKIMTHSFIVRVEPCSKLQMNSVHSTMETQEYAKMSFMSCLMKNLHNQMCHIFYHRQKEGNEMIIFILILGISLDHQGITESWEASTRILENSGIIQIKLKVNLNYYLL